MNMDAPKIHGCTLSVSQPEVGFAHVAAEFKAYGVALAGKVPPGAEAIAMEDLGGVAAKAALRFAKLASLLAVDVEEWFALGDRIRMAASGAIGTIKIMQRQPEVNRVWIRWEAGNETEMFEDDLLFGLHDGTYVLAFGD